MRRINFEAVSKEIGLNSQEFPQQAKSVAASVWICVNCWEVVLGLESKTEHVNARHLLTSSLADSEPATMRNFLRLCRIYGRINPEETHVVLLYVPLYVRNGIDNGVNELPHIIEERLNRENKAQHTLNELLKYI